MIEERDKDLLRQARARAQEAEAFLWSKVGTAREGDPMWGDGSPGHEAYKAVYDAVDIIDTILGRHESRRKSA